MKLIISFIIIGLCIIKTNAQTTFHKTISFKYFDYLNFMEPTSDGGFIIAGSVADLFTILPDFGPVPTQYDAILIKVNNYGDTLWTKTYGDTLDDAAFCVKQTFDGGYIISGWTKNFGAIKSDAYLLKTDSIGNEKWFKIFGGIEKETGNYVIQTNDGGYIITGWSDSFGQGDTDFLIIKTDSNGNTLWEKIFGGFSHDEGNSIFETSDGGYVIAGSTHSEGSGGYDMCLLKVNSLGDSLWLKTYGGNNWDVTKFANQTNDGGFIISGWTQSFDVITSGVFIVKTDENGDSLWSKIYGDIYNEGAYFVEQTNDNGYLICGSNYLDSINQYIYLLRTDTNGDTLWTKNYGIGVASYMHQTNDGGYIISGTTDNTSEGGTDIFFIKLDSIGNVNTVVEHKQILNFVNIYPNPTDGNLIMAIPDKSSEVIITNTKGQVIQTIFVNDKQTQLNISITESGIYLLNIISNNEIITKKIIVIR